MTCSFFGHRDATDSVRGVLKDTVLKIIDEKGIKKFYVGNNENFDFLAQSVLAEIAKIRNDIEYSIVISFLAERALGGEQSATVFPEQLDKVPPKFAVSRRNAWLIKNSSFIIAYSKRAFSNTAATLEKALRQGIEVINISRYEI